MELEQEQSYQREDEIYENENGRRSYRLKRKEKKTDKYLLLTKRRYEQESGSVDSSSDFQQIVRIQQTAMNNRPRRNLSERNYRFDDEQFDQIVADEECSSDKSEDDVEEERDWESGGIFFPEIAQILWRREKGNQNEYLVRHREQSYLHVKWLLEEEIINNNKQKLNRFNKVFDKRVIEDVMFNIIIMEKDLDIQHENQFFDPQYTEVDRILATTDIFPIVHPKKGSELKGTPKELLQIVALKLLNFTKAGVKYGIYFMEPVDPEKEGCPNYRKIVSQPMDLGSIVNRVYLGLYRDSTSFWNDLGLVFRNCRRFNTDSKSDILRVGDTLRECAIVLYRNWYDAMQSKYSSLISSKKIQEQSRIQITADLQTEWLSALVNKFNTNSLQPQQFIQEELGIDLPQEITEFTLDTLRGALKAVGYDIPIDENEVENIMKNQNQETEFSHEWQQGEFSHKWLNDSHLETDNTNFKFITQKDIDEKLSLETEIDRLYLVKWKNLSYTEATWEKESNIANTSKLLEFRMFNRSLDKDTRILMQQQSVRHRALLDWELGIKKRKLSHQAIHDMKSMLYFYGAKREVHQYVPSTQPIFKERRLLRDYQLQSLNWLISSWYDNRNVILADEMGLGKTVQAIAFLNHLYSLEGCRGPFLVVAPLSTLAHWKRTVEEWTNMNAVLYYDQEGGSGRSVCRYYEYFYTDISTKGVLLHQQEIVKFQVLITSYEVFLMDSGILQNLAFQFVVIDEAHRLKNSNARILQALKKLPCKRTLLLTGTPVQNNTDELFSLLNFIEPKHFPSQLSFKQEFGDLNSAEQIERLNKLLKPYIIRRQKEDVEQQIPPLQETIIDIEMTTVQKTLYKALYERNKSMLLQGFSQSAASATQLNNLEIQLRKCCNHPFLVKEMQHELTKECFTVDEYCRVLVESSGKMILLEKLLCRFREEGRKVLIFSQFVYMLGLIEEFLKWKSVKYEKIDGQVKARERQNSIDRFNDVAKGRDVFLLSTKAGGQGINLTAAEVVIIFDSDWNPQNDVQATARAHRIGQSKEVTVYRLVTKNTYEAEMFERATRKLGLDQAIFMTGAFKLADDFAVTQEKKLTKHEIETLLRKGILGLVQSEQQDNNINLLSDTVDDILNNSSRTAKYSLINGTYTIQKSSFVSENADQSLRIEDPNFWQLILKNTESRTLKLRKHFELHQGNQLRNSVVEQKRFMLDIADSVNVLVESKLSHQGLNTDDENNIKQILNEMIASKFFPKKIKDLALNWMDEIDKPTRRFKKITAADLDLQFSVSQSDLVQAPKVAVSVPKVRAPVVDEQFVACDGEDAKRLAMKSREELLKKLCYVCERPNCSQYCLGYCRRAFHEQCRDFLSIEPQWVNVDGAPAAFLQDCHPWELTEEVQALNIKYQCPDCAQNVVICQICRKRGSFYPNESSKSKQQDILDVNNPDYECNGDASVEVNEVFEEESSRFTDSKYKKVKRRDTQNSRKRTGKPISQLSKCSTANCIRYFHLDCIRSHPHSKMLEQSDTLFRCPAHVCCYCRANSSNTSTALMHCIRCCRSFHMKCAPNEARRRQGKVSKKLMLCDQCNKDKCETIIKIQLEPQQTRNMKQMKLEFKMNGNVMKLKRADVDANPTYDHIQKSLSLEPVVIIPAPNSITSTNHAYKNLRKRRNRPFDKSRSKSPEPVQIPIKKKLMVSKKKIEPTTLTYEDLGIPSVHDFDYQNYQRDWCRYCGARFASNFTKGPWGSRTLCTIHYINWGQKKTLDLSLSTELPQQPINRDDPTELQFIQRCLTKDDTFNPKKELENYMLVRNVPGIEHEI